MKQRVYDFLLTIPRGKVVTYGQIGELLGNKGLARALGGIKEQQRRLEADGIEVKNGRVDLKKYQL